MKPNLIRFVPAFIWSITSFILLVMPGSDIPKSKIFDIAYFDKWIHIGMFGLLTLLWGYAFFKTRMSYVKFFTQIAVTVIIYGIAMEFVQKYFAYERSFDIIDILADICGSLIAWCVLIYTYKTKRGITKK